MSRQVVAILVGVLVAGGIGFGINFAMIAAGAGPIGTVSLPGIGEVSTLWGPGLAMGSCISYAIMNLAGNKRVRRADEATKRAALALALPPGAGLVIVFREGFFGKANGIDISLDGRELAQLKSPRFTAFQAVPGRHALKAVMAGQVNNGSVPGTAEFELGAGQTVMFQIGLKMKLTTSDVVLTRVPEPAAVVGKLGRMQMIAAAV